MQFFVNSIKMRFNYLKIDRKQKKCITIKDKSNKEITYCQQNIIYDLHANKLQHTYTLTDKWYSNVIER